MRLISMTDFVLDQMKFASIHHEDDSECLDVIFRYANFLKQPLKLEMFVPCDDEGNVLEEPNRNRFKNEYLTEDQYKTKFLKYQQAKERCLFEGFEYKQYHAPTNSWFIKSETVKLNDGTFRNYKTIETLTKFDLTLTESAKKQIGI